MMKETGINKKKSIKKIIFLITITIVALVICFIPIYNEVLTPFEGYDMTMLTNYDNASNSTLCESFYNFYDDVVSYKSYENRYNLKFYYRRGKDCLFPQITMQFNHYTMESYSLIIEPLSEFNQVNDYNLSTLKFISTPIGYGDSLVFIDGVQFDNWEFKELYYKTDDNYPIDAYKKSIRKTSYWYAFNEETKEISFSILKHEPSLDAYSSINDLIKYIEKNLYHK